MADRPLDARAVASTNGFSAQPRRPTAHSRVDAAATRDSAAHSRDRAALTRDRIAELRDRKLAARDDEQAKCGCAASTFKAGFAALEPDDSSATLIRRADAELPPSRRNAPASERCAS